MFVIGSRVMEGNTTSVDQAVIQPPVKALEVIEGRFRLGRRPEATRTRARRVPAHVACPRFCFARENQERRARAAASS